MSNASSDERRKAKAGPIVFDIEVDPVDPSVVAISSDTVGQPGTRRAIQPAGEPTVWLAHNRVQLALHKLRASIDHSCHPLLLLHGLGESTAADPPEVTKLWPGEIWGLDFTGHGRSTVPRGGGYTAELLMADVDIALAHLGATTIWGRGLGAYVALLIQGARPELVRGVILTDGPGMVGGGIGPSSPRVTVTGDVPAAPDPFALQELTVDLRPPDYALGFYRQAAELSGMDYPVALVARVRPPWIAALKGEPGVRVVNGAEALAFFAAMN